jgi:hypothetical protein
MWSIDPIQILAILSKLGHGKGRSLMGDREQKKQVKIVNMVDIHSIQNEYRTFKPVEITTRRGPRQKGEK